MKRLLVTTLFFMVLSMMPVPGIADCGKMELDFQLAVPEEQSQKGYLGLDDGKTFALSDIKADMVIIEIFSMYCPICQAEADKVNRLFELIQADDLLKERVKLIGIGAGNSSFEVDFFRKNYQIPFPLFSDGDFTIHKKIGEVQTPCFITLAPDKDLEVFYCREGRFKDPGQFLDHLVKPLKSPEDTP
ncbi:MAG TPA: redoxin domain-containing protein [Desulfobacteraceae bacterium]|nr:redoxin domain-containing protein [Desulfobacteraceae bacterium]